MHRSFAAGIAIVLALSMPAFAPLLALADETPKRGGTLTYMIPADAPPSFDGHREATFATIHAVAPFYSVLIRANPENAATALRSGGVVVVFPGGDYDAYRPTFSENVIDFNGRNGYVRTAIEAGVPIVPAVSIGGQETQLYLSRGTWLAERLGIKRLRRSAILPLSFGFPFGLSAVIPPNLPLPTKIVTQVLEPIDVAAQFGEDPDTDEVDEHVRSVMQQALYGLAAKRRFPILG